MSLAPTVTGQGGRGTPQPVSGTVTVIIEGDSKFDGADLQLLMSKTNDSTKFAPVDDVLFSRPQVHNIVSTGSYYLVAEIKNAGPKTLINLVIA